MKNFAFTFKLSNMFDVTAKHDISKTTTWKPLLKVDYFRASSVKTNDFFLLNFTDKFQPAN